MRKPTLILSAAALTLAGTGSLVAQDNARPDRAAPVTKAQFTERAGAMFARMDANSDGVIDAADREARQAQRFARLDSDGNGEVTQAEMQAARDQRQARVAERRAERMERRAERRVERSADRFTRLDSDGSGGVSQSEMAAAREQWAERRAERRAERGTAGQPAAERRGKRGMRGGMMAGLVRQADADRDGTVTRAEFDAAVAAHFARIDANGDGTIEADERRTARQAMRAEMQQRRAARMAQ